MKTAFISLSYQHRESLSPVIAAIEKTLESVDMQARVFVNEYTFTPDQQQEMMQAALRDIRQADLLIAEVSYKQIGIGIEMGYAKGLNKPIIYLRQANAEASTTAGGIATEAIVYEDVDDLAEKLREALEQIIACNLM